MKVMKTRARVVAVLTAAAVASASSACTTEPDAVDVSGLDLITTDTSDPQTALIPADSADVPGQTVINLLYSGLMYLDKDGNPHNDMAESVTQVDDTTYDVVIRDDAVFADGSAVDAQDFVDTWNTAVRQSLLAAHNFEPILGYNEGQETMRGLKVTGEKTFRIKLSRPTAGFIERLGYSVFFPMRSEDQDKLSERGEDPIGNGPYQLASWEHDKSLIVVPNPKYDGPRTPRNEGIEFKVYRDVDKAYQDLLDDDLDVLTLIPDERRTTFQDDLGERAVNQPTSSILEITIPANDSNFRGEAGLLRRRALSMAIDREKITRDLFHGTATPARGFSAPIGNAEPSRPQDTSVFEYHPDRARELWAEAEKLDPFEGTFSVAYNNDGSHGPWVRAVTDQISATLGISAEPQPFDTFKELRHEVTARHITGAFRTSWQAEFPDEITFLSPLFASHSAANESGFSSSEYDELLQKAGEARTKAEEREYYSQAQDLLVEAMPAIPLWTPNAVGGYGTDIEPASFSWKPIPDYHNLQRK